MLKDIIGQPKALRILSGTLRKNRVPSSVLMLGEKGTGKRLAAINYAKAINCSDLFHHDSCDKCISCKKTDSRAHPDVYIIEPENDEIRIDVVRKLEETLSLKPFEGRKKVVVIDDSDKMNANAANAFLKTLEEPPDNSIIILLSSNEDGMPDTIKSRCVKINFYPLPAEICRKMISGHVNPDDLTLYINLSMGRPGIANTRNFAQERAFFFKLYNNMLSDNSKEIWADKEQMKAWLDMSIVFMRDMAVYEITNSESDMMLGKPFKCSSIKNVLDVYNTLQQTRNRIDFNLNKNITWNYVSAVVKSLS